MGKKYLVETANTDLRSLYDKEEYSTGVEGYGEFKSGRLSYLKTLIVNYVKPMRGDFCVDLGCGVGEIANAISERNCIVVGVDFAMEGLRIGRNNGLEFMPVCADVTALPFKSKVFDIAISSDLIEHLPAHQTDLFLSEAKRVLGERHELLIHTAPNTLFMKSMYYFGLLFLIVTGRFETYQQIRAQSKTRSLYHLNEFSPHRLQRVLTQYFPTGKLVWLVGISRDMSNRLTKDLPFQSLINIIDKLSRLPAIRHIMINDLYFHFKTR